MARPVMTVYNVTEDQGNLEVCFIQEVNRNMNFKILTSDKTAISKWVIAPIAFTLFFLFCREL